jgi:hypothetical protein
LAAQEKIEVESPEDGLTPLIAAAIYRMANIIPDLVARGANVTICHIRSPLMNLTGCEIRFVLLGQMAE